MQLSRLGQTIVKKLSPANFIEDFPRRAGRVVTTLVLVILCSTMLTHAAVFAQEPAQADEPQQSAADLQKLVAPIALYPDSLIAQILAASTYPTQVVEAERWLQSHSNLQGEELGRAADQQSWDPSVKALVQFPAVLANLDKNLSWTTALGDAYYNQQQDVLDAVQVMRRRAEDAGNLRPDSHQRVISDGPTIIIEPVDPYYCYVPLYDPWIVYGPRIIPYPGYYYDPWYGPAFVSYGPRINLGFFFGFGWGWRSWGCNWHNHFVVFNRNRYFSRSIGFSHHAGFAVNRAGNRIDSRGQFNNRSARVLGASDHNRGSNVSGRNVDRGRTATGRSGAVNNRGAYGYGESRSRTSGNNTGRQNGIQRGSVYRGRDTYTGSGRTYNSGGGRTYSAGGGRTYNSGGGRTYNSGGGRTYSNSGGGRSYSSSGGGRSYSSGGGGRSYSSGGGGGRSSGGGGGRSSGGGGGRSSGGGSRGGGGGGSHHR